MALKKKEPPKPPGVPLWFLTYSDVITLLMTFFILLLTFATNEPEHFERMQATVFGAGGASGIVRESDSSLERDALLLRVRPRSSRLTTRGTETPPIHADPANESLASGLQSMDTALEHDLQTTRSIELELPALVDDRSNLTSFGKAVARRLASNLAQHPILINLQVTKEAQLPQAIAFGEFLTATANLPLGRVGVGLRQDNQADPTKLRLIFSRIWSRIQ